MRCWCCRERNQLISSVDHFSLDYIVIRWSIVEVEGGEGEAIIPTVPTKHDEFAHLFLLLSR